MKKVPRAKRKRLKRTTVRNSYGAGNHHFGMHGSEGALRHRLALHEHSQQAQPLRPVDEVGVPSNQGTAVYKPPNEKQKAVWNAPLLVVALLRSAQATRTEVRGASQKRRYSSVFNTSEIFLISSKLL